MQQKSVWVGSNGIMALWGDVRLFSNAEAYQKQCLLGLIVFFMKNPL